MMKKGFGLYCIIWAVMFILFVAGVLVTPDTWGVFYKYGGSFWAGYVIIMIAFLAQFTITAIAFKNKSREFFYNIPVIKISYAGLILTMIAGIICMVIPNFPWWATILVCGLIMVAYLVSITKAKTAADIVSQIDTKIETQTAFIREMTAKAKLFAEQNKSDEAKKVYESLRYSDPMSTKELFDIENKIKNQFILFTTDHSAESAEKLISLIKERNEKCKMLK